MNKEQLKRLKEDLLWNENGLPYDINDAEDLKALIDELKKEVGETQP
jgi:hypothetical protein